MKKKKKRALAVILFAVVSISALADATIVISPQLTAAMAQVLSLQTGAPAPALTPAPFDQRFPASSVGNALHMHLTILTDVTNGADERKTNSISALRANAAEASRNLLNAYHVSDSSDYFGRFLITTTLMDLNTSESFAALHEIATSEISPDGLNDHGSDHFMNESIIRQSAIRGLAVLARSGNASAEADLLNLSLNPASGDDASRVLAIKGYLAAGPDYATRVQRLKSQLPQQYAQVVTLVVTTPPRPPALVPAQMPVLKQLGD